MALYKDGNPVSGLNSIPRLTLAQYNALNVKPEFWVRTDAPESYKKLSADQVSYDSNNTVKDMLTGEALNATSTVGTLGGTFRRIGNLGIFCGAITFTSAITENESLIIDLGVSIKGSANWSGVKQSGNTLTPARGYILGRYVYSQVTASANEAIIFTAVFEIA